MKPEARAEGEKVEVIVTSQEALVTMVANLRSARVERCQANGDYKDF